MGLRTRRKAMKWIQGFAAWAHVAKDNAAASQEDRNYARGVDFYIRSLGSNQMDPEERGGAWPIETLDGMQDANFLVNDVLHNGLQPSGDYRSVLRRAHIKRMDQERDFLAPKLVEDDGLRPISFMSRQAEEPLADPHDADDTR